MSAREFHLGDVLTITTGLLVSPRHVDGIYDILNFMTGDNLFTHQLPRGMEECQPHLLAQHPQLAEVEAPETFDGEAHVKAWLAEQVARYGEHLPVEPLAAADHTRIDPLAELGMMGVGPERVIVVRVDGDPPKATP